MKARNLDQNIVYFPKVDSERIEKKGCFIKTRNPFLDLKRLYYFLLFFFFARVGSCAVMTRSENSFLSFIFPFVQKHFIGRKKAIAN